MADEDTDLSAFEGMLDDLLTVPKSVLKEHIDAHKARAAENPHRPGRKPAHQRAVQMPRNGRGSRAHLKRRASTSGRDDG